MSSTILVKVFNAVAALLGSAIIAIAYIRNTSQLIHHQQTQSIKFQTTSPFFLSVTCQSSPLKGTLTLKNIPFKMNIYVK